MQERLTFLKPSAFFISHIETDSRSPATDPGIIRANKIFGGKCSELILQLKMSADIDFK